MSISKVSQDLYKAYNEAFNNLGKPDNDGISFTGTDWYQSAIAAAGDNQDYLRLVNSNPYLNFTRHQTGWQKFLSNLGFNTNYDAYVQQMEQSAREYNSNVMANISENNYNSYEQDMARQRAAGYNPDLLGAQGLGQMSANESPNPTGTPEIESPGTQIGNFMDNIGNAISIGFNFVSSIQDVKAKSLNLEALKIGNISEYESFSDSLISRVIRPWSTEDEKVSNLDAIKNFNYKNIFPFLSNRQVKKLNSVLSSYTSDPKAMDNFWQRYDSMQRSKNSYTKESSYYGEDENGFMNTISKSVIQPLIDLQKSLDKISLSNENRSQGVEAGNLSVYEKAPGSSATAEVAENSARASIASNSKLSAEAEEQLQSTYRKIINNLSEDKSFWSQALLLGFMLIRNMSGSIGVGPKGMTKSLGF